MASLFENLPLPGLDTLFDGPRVDHGGESRLPRTAPRWTDDPAVSNGAGRLTGYGSAPGLPCPTGKSCRHSPSGHRAGHAGLRPHRSSPCSAATAPLR